MIRLVPVVMMSVWLPALPAQAQPRSDAAREATAKELRQLLADLTDASRKRDRAALERIYADEFLWIQAAGQIVDKQEQIASLLGTDPVEPTPPVLDELHLYGDVALARWRDPAWIATHTFVRRAGRWQYVQIQGTPLRPPRKPIHIDPGILDSAAPHLPLRTSGG